MTDRSGSTPAGIDGLPEPSGPQPDWADDLDAEAAQELERRRAYMEKRPGVTAAQGAVREARAGLSDELVRLEASARAAFDIPSRVRREPAKTAGIAAGTAFLVLGGPGRVFRRVRRAVLGPQAELPKSMLPDEIEKELHKLGDDGKRVRAVLEREFVQYLDDRADIRRDRDLGATVSWLAANLVRVASLQAGKRLLERLFAPDAPGYEAALKRARERTAQRGRSDGDRST